MLTNFIGQLLKAQKSKNLIYATLMFLVFITIRRSNIGTSGVVGKQLKNLMRERKSIPMDLITKTMFKNLRKNRELIRAVTENSSDSYVVNPVMIVCPVCGKEIKLGHTGCIRDFKNHLAAVGVEDVPHKDFLTSLNSKEPFNGQ